MNYVLFDSDNVPYAVTKNDFYSYINELDVKIFECGTCFFIIHFFYENGRTHNECVGVIEIKQ